MYWCLPVGALWTDWLDWCDPRFCFEYANPKLLDVVSVADIDAEGRAV